MLVVKFDFISSNRVPVRCFYFMIPRAFSFRLQMQQRNIAVVDMEAKLNEMKSKSDEYTDKVLCSQRVLDLRLLKYQRLVVQ